MHSVHMQTTQQQLYARGSSEVQTTNNKTAFITKNKRSLGPRAQALHVLGWLNSALRAAAYICALRGTHATIFYYDKSRAAC